MNKDTQQELCTKILAEELVPAMGCTEPVALAYAAAYAAHLLDRQPEKLRVGCSANIIKNVKAVTVPNTGGLHGIQAAVLGGARSGRSDLELECLQVLTDTDRLWLKEALNTFPIEVYQLDSPYPLHLEVEAWAGTDQVSVEIIHTHTGLGRVEKNGRLLHERPAVEGDQLTDRSFLTLPIICDYANQVDLDRVRSILEAQINCNETICQEGLTQDWGECVGKTLWETGDDRKKLIAAAAAGSDARMNGCPLPVVTNSGSGNQGITASIPLIRYATQIGADHDRLLRALCVSNLTAIYIKTDIGRLSAFCGAVSAAAGAAVGMAWLDGQDPEVLSGTLINALATTGGIVCDGAKSSCAAKIAASLDAALMGYDMAKKGRVFRPGEGLVKDTLERTVAGIGRMAAVGMKSTDEEILRIMLED